MTHYDSIIRGFAHAAVITLVYCAISITLSLRTIATPPASSEINQLLSVGFTLRDPEGHLVDRVD
jgi:hypothetical protein